MKMSFTDFLFYRAAPQIKSRPSEPLIFQQTKKERGELDICNNGGTETGPWSREQQRAHIASPYTDTTQCMLLFSHRKVTHPSLA